MTVTAVGSDRFVVCPAAFNAYVAFNARELGLVAGDRICCAEADELAELIDELLWDEVDEPVGGPSGRRRGRPLASDPDLRRSHAVAGVGRPGTGGPGAGDAQRSEDRSAAPRSGRPTSPSNQPCYDPGAYWRGAAWPQMSYLLWLPLGAGTTPRIADQIARNTIAGAEASGWAEYWNPDTGEGLGAVPQSWTALAATMAPERAAWCSTSRSRCSRSAGRT